MGNLELEAQDIFDRTLGLTKAMWEHMQTYKYTSPMDSKVQAILKNTFKIQPRRSQRGSSVGMKRKSSFYDNFKH